MLSVIVISLALFAVLTGANNPLSFPHLRKLDPITYLSQNFSGDPLCLTGKVSQHNYNQCCTSGGDCSHPGYNCLYYHPPCTLRAIQTIHVAYTAAVTNPLNTAAFAVAESNRIYNNSHIPLNLVLSETSLDVNALETGDTYDMFVSFMQRTVPTSNLHVLLVTTGIECGLSVRPFYLFKD